MVRTLLFTLLLTLQLQAETFQSACASCHEKLPIGFDKFYMQYLIRFSSEGRIKEAMFYYLRDPKKEQSVMERTIIKRLGIMPKVALDDEILKEMIETYIKTYDVRKKLH